MATLLGNTELVPWSNKVYELVPDTIILVIYFIYVIRINARKRSSTALFEFVPKAGGI